MVALDDWSTAPISACEAYAAATGRLDERRRDRETFLRWCPEARSRVRRRDRQLLQHQTEIGRMVGEAARQENLCVHGVAVHRTVRHLPLVLVDDARNEDMVLEV